MCDLFSRPGKNQYGLDDSVTMAPGRRILSGVHESLEEKDGKVLSTPGRLLPSGKLVFCSLDLK